MIVIDYSGVAIAAIMMFQEDLHKPDDELENIIRHVILSSIKNIKKRHNREYGPTMVIACDGQDYWRKDIFPHYKASRKKEREKSDIPWEKIHRYMDLVREELREHFPYKVIRVNKAEADDVFAVIVNDIALNSTTKVGLYDEEEPVLIVSSDKDLKQLLVRPSVKMWLHRDNKFAKLEEPVKMFLRRLILTGDTGDGVPNVFSPNDSFVAGIRQKPATEKKMAPLLEAKNMADAAPDDLIKQRILENAKLIAFNFIPEYVQEEIREAYHAPVGGNKMTIFNYLASKKMKQMLEDIEEF